MQFDSFTFLVFFALVLTFYNAFRGWNARKNFLLGASYLFYSAWNPPFVLLLLASTTLDWWIALRIADATEPRTRRRWIAATLIVNLVVLGYFKYAGFLLDNFTWMLSLAGITYKAARPDIVLPIGISFYTFHSLSYCLDVYRDKFAPTRSWRDYALYVGFFPQLVAGPIVRWTQIGEQLVTPRLTSAQGLGLGLTLLTLGLFEKVVLADSVFAPVAEQAFGAIAQLDSAAAWIGMTAFSGQIFCDFAGYSTCAIGAAMALGFALPINFHQPYAALGFSDFWRRWHMSLSSWLRDYLYVGLGGNRHGELSTYRNLMLTMLIGGLWHGAAWTFVAWGALHGTYLAIERFLREHLWPAAYRAPKILGVAYGAFTLLAVMYAWVWFRVRNFSDGVIFSGKLTGIGGTAASLNAISFEQRVVVGTFVAVVLTHVLCRRHDARALLDKAPKPLLILMLAAMLAAIALSPGDNHAFIYFQF